MPLHHRHWMAHSFKESRRQPIRSFVLRKGRLTPAQQRALADLWPSYGIDFEASPLDFTPHFGRLAPLVVEIGFGNGYTLVEMAKAEPAINFIGIEVHRPGVGAALARIDATRLSNVRVISEDAVTVLESMIPAASLAGLRLFFPDPWPKKRHHKRRLVQPAFLELLATRLCPGAVVHMATDWRDYAEQMLELLKQNPEFRNTSADNSYIERPAWRPQTHFEQRGTRLGHGVWDILFTRC